MSEFLQAISTTHKGLTKDVLLEKLGLFSFRGLKYENEAYEFRHPFFRKNCYKDLHLVKKSQQHKKIRKLQKVNIEIVDRQPDALSLEEQIAKLREVVDTMIVNNNKLVAVNNTLISQLSMLKSQCDSKMNDVLKMLLNTITTPNSQFVNIYKSVFEDFNIDPNLALQTQFIDHGAIDYLNFYQTATANKISLFSLFDRMNSAYDMFKAHLLAKMARQTIEGLSNYSQQFNGCLEDRNNLANPKIDLKILQYDDSKGVCLESPGLQGQMNGKIYAKDDIVLEELKQAHKFMKEIGNEDLPDTVSLSNYTYIHPSTHSSEDM